MDALDDLPVTKRQLLGIVLGVVAVLMIAFPVLADTMLTETYENEYNTSATIVEENNSSMNIGVDPGANLHFGRTTAGVGMRKFVNINVTGPTYFVADVSGNISEYITPETGLYIKEDTEVQVEFKSNQTGYYEGTIRLQTQLATSSLGARWLKIKSLLS